MVKNTSIYKHGERWRARAQKTVDGKVIRVEKDCKTKKEAEDAIPALKAKLEDRVRVVSTDITDKTTLREAFELWINYKLQNDKKELKPQSLTRIKMTIKLINEELGELKVREISDSQLQAFLRLMKDRGRDLGDGNYKPQGYSSVKKMYDALNAMYAWAYKRKYIYLNPMDLVEMLDKSRWGEEEDPDVNFYTPEECQKLKEECLRLHPDGRLVHRYGPLFVLMLNTGIRVGEAAALMRSDIDGDIMTINKTMIMLDNQPTLQSTPKTSRSNRTLKLNNTSQEMIKIMTDTFPDIANGMLNYSVRGTYVPTAKLNRYLDEILMIAGIEKKGGCHTLRDTYATRLIDLGEDIIVVSRLLGHKDSSVTERHYVKKIREREAKASTALEL